MKDFLTITLIIIIAMIGLGIFGIVFHLSSNYVIQKIEKNTWGGFQYKITVDNTWYATNEYNIDENNCINFIDNYEQNWTWCEKYSVGEYYFHNNNPNLKTIWFGY